MREFTEITLRVVIPDGRKLHPFLMRSLLSYIRGFTKATEVTAAQRHYFEAERV